MFGFIVLAENNILVVKYGSLPFNASFDGEKQLIWYLLLFALRTGDGELLGDGDEDGTRR